jgi:proteasome lid subunit RPN8/RPN11
MSTPFERFCEVSINWIRQYRCLELIEQIYRPTLEADERPPDEETRWNVFLQAHLPAAFVELQLTSPNCLDDIKKRLRLLTPFNRQKSKLAVMIDQSLLRFMSPVDKEWLAERIHDFDEQQDAWAEGTWHRTIRSDRRQALIALRRKTGVDNDWIMASMLSRMGYFFPSSQRSLIVWQQWFDGNSADTDYWQWWRLLSEVTTTPLERYRLDRLLDAATGGTVVPGLPPLCRSLRDCRYCPLQSTCQKSSAETNEQAAVENALRTDEWRQLDNKRLIQYLAADRRYCRGANDLIDAAIDGRLISAVAPPTDEEDEALFLFLKGLQVWSLHHGRRSVEAPPAALIKNSLDIYHQLRDELSSAVQESFYTLILDNKHRRISLQHISKGTINQSLVHPREVFAPAIQLRATSVVLLHNHPSGDPHPSAQDIDITKRLIEVGQIVGIKVIDHVIVGQDAYFSFMDEGILFDHPNHQHSEFR